jgi:hypothetical protein
MILRAPEFVSIYDGCCLGFLGVLALTHYA